ncbi:MAG: hypothetical protein ABI639_10855 [Thermoanaerobaculia bacterium]
MRGGAADAAARTPYYDSPMRSRRWHKVLGLALVLPIGVWAGTGLLFHLKPGWSAAYASLERPDLPLAGGAPIVARDGWLETRRFRTVLGDHLLVREATGWQHLDARTLAPFVEPGTPELTAFIQSAIDADERGRARYGTIASRDGDTFLTSTGVRITLDWKTVRLSQEGKDTQRIDGLYRIHYLQWTGVPAVDRPFAVAGLLGLVLLAAFGLRLAFRPRAA